MYEAMMVIELLQALLKLYIYKPDLHRSSYVTCTTLSRDCLNLVMFINVLFS